MTADLATTPNTTHSNASISAYGPARSTIKGAPLEPDELRRMDAYWRASLYLSLGMLYLKDNPLLRKPLGSRTPRRGCSVIGGRTPASRSPIRTSIG